MVVVQTGAVMAFPAALGLFAVGKAAFGHPVKAAMGAAPVGTINALHTIFLLAGRNFTPYFTMPARARNTGYSVQAGFPFADMSAPGELPMRYDVVLIRSEESYAVPCPALPPCWSQGATRAEALENIRDAIAEYLDYRAKRPPGGKSS